MRKRKKDILQEKLIKNNKLLNQGKEEEFLIENTLKAILKRNLTTEVLSEALDKWDITKEQYNDTINYLK